MRYTTTNAYVTCHREPQDPVRLNDKRTGWAPANPAAHRILYWLKGELQREGKTVGKHSTSGAKGAIAAPCTSEDVPYLIIKDGTGKSAALTLVWYDAANAAKEAGAAWRDDSEVTFRRETVDLSAYRKARRYADKWIAAYNAGDVPAPSGGDCWLCSMLGDKSAGHYESHIDEGYYVPSLAVRAVEACPQKLTRSARMDLQYRWHYGNTRPMSRYSEGQIRKAITVMVGAALSKEVSPA